MNRYKKEKKNAILGRKLTSRIGKMIALWKRDICEKKGDILNFVANVATYLETSNEVKLKLNNHKMLLSVVTLTEYHNLI